MSLYLDASAYLKLHVDPAEIARPVGHGSET
ncbi:hypothetical protein BH20CHL6_BH20CHL6_16370 [soil metagenome]